MLTAVNDRNRARGFLEVGGVGPGRLREHGILFAEWRSYQPELDDRRQKTEGAGIRGRAQRCIPT
jgi:hypothetical protein